MGHPVRVGVVLTANDLPPLTYLTVDSVSEGIGASQVLAYVERLALRGVRVHLHSFEKVAPRAALGERFARVGATWTPHPFRRHGTAGGLERLGIGARAVHGAELVHARSDLAAASTMLARVPHWLWDVRSLWVDQRIDLGTLSSGSAQERVLRKLEGQAARRSTAIVTLTHAVIPELQTRHGSDLAQKTTVISTCVDTERFEMSSMPPMEPLRLLLAGTINRYYDVPAMVHLVETARRRRPTELILLTPAKTAWEDLLRSVQPQRNHVAHDEMPEHIAASHVGLVVCRSDVGISRLGSMPTKIAEFLSSGRPVVINEGLGDASQLVRDHSCGVVMDDTSPAGIEATLDRLEALLADPEAPARCRALAEERFDLDRATDQLVALYHKMAM